MFSYLLIAGAKRKGQADQGPSELAQRPHHDGRKTASAPKTAIRRRDQGESLRVHGLVGPTRRAAEGRAQRAAHHDGRPGLRCTEHLRRRHPHACHGSHRSAGTALHQLPLYLALLTDAGGDHHRAQPLGNGLVGEIATGFPGYDSIIPIEKGTIGTILKANGYATSWFGKDHNTPSFQSSQAGPFDQWPNGMGFDYFYGFVGGDASQWQSNLFRNTTAIYPFQGNPSWNLETAMADEAIQHIKQLKEIAPEKPFFVYYVPGATHAPHHPTPEWIKKISDMHLGLSSIKPDDSSGQVDRSEEISGCLVVACGNCPVLLELAEEVL